MTVLSVNLNKIAVLRNSRGGLEPSVQDAARVAIESGADGITVHPRPDQRHIRPEDVFDLKNNIAVELNLEGNPFAGVQSNGYPGFVSLVQAAKPAQCTLVPDSDQQITSDHGFDLRLDGVRLKPIIARLKAEGMRISLFMDADSPDIERAAEIGADRIEIYTGPFAQAFARGAPAEALDICASAAVRAQNAGLGVNAGHDLSQVNLGTFLSHVPNVLEVSIGHALIGEALYQGLAKTIQTYQDIIANAKS